MNFRRGDSVEVLRREDDDDPCGSWFTGNIVSADGENYVVRYNLLMDHRGKQAMEKLQGKDVRPLPPSVNGKSWVVGDVAEVFNIRSWKVGKIAKVLKNNDRFVIKLFGSIQLKEFHASSLRIRQAWDGKKWMVIGKVAQCKDLTNNFAPKFRNRASGLLFRSSLHLSETPQFTDKDREGMHKGGADDATMRAISKGCDHQSEECKINPVFGGSLRKRKSPPWSRGCNEETLKRTCSLFNQVDDISFPHVGVDGKFIKQSTKKNNRMEHATARCLYDYSRPALFIEDGDQCSVASCSSNGAADSAGRISHRSSASTPDNSDAESSFPYSCDRRKLPLSPIDDKVVDIHELELRAYKSTVEALYASGPLTWGQEFLLTNLRLSLNISDEEHLLQLRHLLSAQVL
ncbi:guanine nucleotide-binding protein subunit gamma 1-like [Hibiscus syriacus]|uniref:Guanine nucleotide-binding protein subunit gamma 1-like n=1 Tax=Hibiscus syriacus TaxID=106335 RepID=A0A6A3CMI6_HIBSY|nr:uncharacterized protein LOC120165879 [Hibiscus syriacus]XP_039031249.1 uncharacterized protein LOC120165879 [Hibiscus syriacus]KAE8730665.1 guanine nucleotide-binding protein subunit gamma 1-like [Hibiscus syriacus]